MSDLQKNRIAVTGSSGQLGKELAAIAHQYPQWKFTFLKREEFPLLDAKKMEKWIVENPVDIFINCAAYTAVDKAESDQENAFQVNAKAPGMIAELLAVTNAKLIQISTDYVFDGQSAIPLTEQALTDPINFYGSSKLEGERLALKNNAQTQVIRTSWLYSAYGNNFVKTMMRLMRERESISVVQDQQGTPTYCGDLAVAIMEIIESGNFKPGIYHYSNEGVTNWYEFALEIKRLTGSTCNVSPILSSGFPTPAKRPAYSLLDKTKIKHDYQIGIPEWKTSLSVCIDLLKKAGA